MMTRSWAVTGAVASLALVLTAVAPAAEAATGERYGFDEPGDRDSMTNTGVLERFSPEGGNNQSVKVATPRAEADATFTSERVVVDGIREPAWDAATEYPIANTFDAGMTAAVEEGTRGTVRLLWDGPVLYALVEAAGDTTPADEGATAWSTPSLQPQTDGLFVSMDVFDDRWGIETDTQGVFFLGADPTLDSVATFTNPFIPSLGSFFDPRNQDHSTRLADFASSGYQEGDGASYTYEIALRMEGWGDAWERPLENGTTVGLELGLFDAGRSFSYWSRTDVNAGREGGSNLPNSERVRNRDWGVVTLAGWDGETPPAYSGWRADEDIRFWDSRSNPGGSGNGTAEIDDGDDSAVWTPETRDRMVRAKADYLALREDPDADRVALEAAVREVAEAFVGLRWADQRFPDPRDLPSTTTLPSAFRFFDPAKGTGGRVTTAEEWTERKAEILELAQFYEYGYKPTLGEDYTVEVLSTTYDGSDTATVRAVVTPTNANFAGGAAQTIDIPVTLPAAVPGGRPAAIAFGGEPFVGNGFASVRLPVWGFDVRTDDGAWGAPNRPGLFYSLFPYQRNSTAADSSILIANATAVSVHLDALQLAVEQNPELAARIDPGRAVTRGFSINGKNAFVAAVFDERVEAVVTGGAGATGPANWRYNAQGQEFDLSETPFAAPGAEDVVAFGTEGPGNSYRHNRVRETELFRHFMPYGHMYEHVDGAYAYGRYDRLPFDQSLLVATLAPERAILIDTNVNDFNDGAVTDNMSLQIAKGVYRNLGADPDALVKFNSGAYRSEGDPHGLVDPTPVGKYLSDLLYGTSTLSAAEAAALDVDPYALPVSNDRRDSPYDYYWGGYNTITGGADDVEGTDGWHFAGFDAELAGLVDGVARLGLGRTPTAALQAELRAVPALLSANRAGAAAARVDRFVDRVDALSGSGALDAAVAGALVDRAGQLALSIRTTEGLRPEWSSSAVYHRGDEVVYKGRAWRAVVINRGQRPGNPWGPWQEIERTADGATAWTASRIFARGQVVVHEGSMWRAERLTRNERPTEGRGPWRLIR